MTALRLRQSSIWFVVLAIAIAAPWAFYNYHTGRQSGFVVSMLDLLQPLGIHVSGDNLFTEILKVPVARIGALLPFAMMIIILSFRPRGLMGTRDT